MNPKYVVAIIVGLFIGLILTSVGVLTRLAALVEKPTPLGNATLVVSNTSQLQVITPQTAKPNHGSKEAQIRTGTFINPHQTNRFTLTDEETVTLNQVASDVIIDQDLSQQEEQQGQTSIDGSQVHTFALATTSNFNKGEFNQKVDNLYKSYKSALLLETINGITKSLSQHLMYFLRGANTYIDYAIKCENVKENGFNKVDCSFAVLRNYTIDTLSSFIHQYDTVKEGITESSERDWIMAGLDYYIDILYAKAIVYFNDYIDKAAKHSIIDRYDTLWMISRSNDEDRTKR